MENKTIVKVMIAVGMALFLYALALVIAPDAVSDHQQEQYIQYFPEHGEHCAMVSNDIPTIQAFEALMHGDMTVKAFGALLLERARFYGMNRKDAVRFARTNLMSVANSCDNVSLEESL